MVSVLSVFWLHKNKIYGEEDCVGGPKAIDYGEYAQLNCDHWAIWPTYAKQMGINSRHVEYDRIPRGRVLFHIPSHHHIVIGSSSIIDDEEKRNILINYFRLPPNTEFRKDEHYR